MNQPNTSNNDNSISNNISTDRRRQPRRKGILALLPDQIHHFPWNSTLYYNYHDALQDNPENTGSPLQSSASSSSSVPSQHRRQRMTSTKRQRRKYRQSHQTDSLMRDNQTILPILRTYSSDELFGTDSGGNCPPQSSSRRGVVALLLIDPVHHPSSVRILEQYLDRFVTNRFATTTSGFVNRGSGNSIHDNRDEQSNNRTMKEDSNNNDSQCNSMVNTNHDCNQLETATEAAAAAAVVPTPEIGEGGVSVSSTLTTGTMQPASSPTETTAKSPLSSLYRGSSSLLHGVVITMSTIPTELLQHSGLSVISLAPVMDRQHHHHHEDRITSKSTTDAVDDFTVHIDNMVTSNTYSRSNDQEQDDDGGGNSTDYYYYHRGPLLLQALSWTTCPALAIIEISTGRKISCSVEEMVLEWCSNSYSKTTASPTSVVSPPQHQQQEQQQPSSLLLSMTETAKRTPILGITVPVVSHGIDDTLMTTLDTIAMSTTLMDHVQDNHSSEDMEVPPQWDDDDPILNAWLQGKSALSWQQQFWATMVLPVCVIS